MHLVIPFAAPLSDAGRQALRNMHWPRLAALLAGRAAALHDEGDEWTLTPPHERAWAAAVGWRGADGMWPFAAHQAREDGVDIGGQPCGLLTPVHWHLGTEQLSMGDPAALMLDETGSRALLAAVEQLFTSEGFGVHYGARFRWYLGHPSLDGLPCASLDRVIGRNVDRWLTTHPQARQMRRLQNEVQMLLHEHPLNAEREARGLLAVNSFWLSGCGAAQVAAAPEPVVDDRLRSHALAEDWAAWVKAWAVIDEGLPVAELIRITLCGERSSMTWTVATQGRLQRLAARWNKPDIAAILETL